MSNIWFVSDTHFGHANIIKYCGRPFNDVDDMNKVMTDNWNSVVGVNDIVYHLGDFSFKSTIYKKFLNGKIILIKGNHDRKKFDKDFDEVYDFLELKIGEFRCLLVHRPQVNFSYDFVICGHVHEKFLIKGNNINVGVDQWDFTPVSKDRLLSCLKGMI